VNSKSERPSASSFPASGGFATEKGRPPSPSSSYLTPEREDSAIDVLPPLDASDDLFVRPDSLYPGPSTTISSSELRSSSPARKRPRTGTRPEDPERFLYAGNTFSNLSDQAFQKAVQSNPYLSQLTPDATRPAYKSPMEARKALKASKKASAQSGTPTEREQQIQQLTQALADFRKKYDKCKLMTKQAKIEVAGKAWDRLANIVQCPPDLDSHAQDTSEFVEQMKAWDRAIGHQVIIKKRIVYKEAIEKLQSRLDTLSRETDSELQERPLPEAASIDGSGGRREE
jgi:hypothetical protein